MAAELAPNRTAAGDPVPPLLQDIRKGRGRPKGRKTGTGTTGKAAKARREAAPKRGQALTKTEIQSIVTLAANVLLGREEMSMFEVSSMFGMTDATKDKDWDGLAQKDKDAILASQAEAQRIFDAVRGYIRQWIAPDDRLAPVECQLVGRGVALQAAKLNKAKVRFAGPLARALAPLLPYLRALKREGQTVAIVAALAIPRIARRRQGFSAYAVRMIVGPLQLIGLGKLKVPKPRIVDVKGTVIGEPPLPSDDEPVAERIEDQPEL